MVGPATRPSTIENPSNRNLRRIRARARFSRENEDEPRKEILRSSEKRVSTHSRVRIREHKRGSSDPNLARDIWTGRRAGSTRSGSRIHFAARRGVEADVDKRNRERDSRAQEERRRRGGGEERREASVEEEFSFGAPYGEPMPKREKRGERIMSSTYGRCVDFFQS